MPVTQTIMIGALALASASSALAQSQNVDWARAERGEPSGLKAEIELAGGRVGGTPTMETTEGPDGEPTTAIRFPDTESWIEIPARFFLRWQLAGEIKIETPPFDETQGPIYGMVKEGYPKLAVVSPRFSPTESFEIWCGETELASARELADAVGWDRWEKISLIGEKDEWRATIGDWQGRGSIADRDRTRWDEGVKDYIRIGGFRGWALIPQFAQY